MANYILTLAPGNRGVSLPNGVVITDSEQVVVSEAVYAQVSALIGGLLVDGGTTSDPVTDPEVPGSGGTPGAGGTTSPGVILLESANDEVPSGTAVGTIVYAKIDESGA